MWAVSDFFLSAVSSFLPFGHLYICYGGQPGHPVTAGELEALPLGSLSTDCRKAEVCIAVSFVSLD